MLPFNNFGLLLLLSVAVGADAQSVPDASLSLYSDSNSSVAVIEVGDAVRLSRAGGSNTLSLHGEGLAFDTAVPEFAANVSTVVIKGEQPTLRLADSADGASLLLVYRKEGEQWVLHLHGNGSTAAPRLRIGGTVIESSSDATSCYGHAAIPGPSPLPIGSPSTSVLDFSAVDAGAIIFEGLSVGGALPARAAIVFPASTAAPVRVHGAHLFVGETGTALLNVTDLCGLSAA
jgi:hypothetical protein